MNSSENIFSITPAAAQRIALQLKDRGRGLGLRVGVKSAGCSGYAYLIDYADEVKDGDLVIEQHGATVVIDPESISLLSGTTIDFRREGLNELFRFDNPRAKVLCGCGESFDIEDRPEAEVFD